MVKESVEKTDNLFKYLRIDVKNCEKWSNVEVLPGARQTEKSPSSSVLRIVSKDVDRG